jgi:23S rRNA pseudoU1915 N3-methylase RlmH
MDPWTMLAEARMQEWLRRPAKERETAETEGLPVAPIEVQLVEDARALHAQARGARDPVEAARLRAEAAQIETRIMVLLEQSGRPLAAQQFARVLAEERQKR